MIMSLVRAQAILDPSNLPDSCACHVCTSYCIRTPGLPTPDEAANMLDAGLAPRLMLDWYVTDTDNVLILSPAAQAYGGELAPPSPLFHGGLGRCVFLTKDDQRCELHNSGYKPWECRNAHHANTSRDGRGVREAIAALWDTDHGRGVVERWRELTGCPDMPLDPEDDTTEKMPSIEEIEAADLRAELLADVLDER